MRGLGTAQNAVDLVYEAFGLGGVVALLSVSDGFVSWILTCRTNAPSGLQMVRKSPLKPLFRDGSVKALIILVQS